MMFTFDGEYTPSNEWIIFLSSIPSGLVVSSEQIQKIGKMHHYIIPILSFFFLLGRFDSLIE